MPSGSTVAITVAGINVTNKVLFRTARFESQLGAIPGVGELTLKDPDQELEFFTGDEWTIDVDGTRLWGGFVILVNGRFAFPAVDTTNPSQVKARQWLLQGVDYNILFDKRVIHNPSDHFHHLPFFNLDQTMGDLLRNELFALYLDLGDDGLNTTTFVDDTFVPRFDADGVPDPDATKKGSWPQQGSYWRKAMEDFAQYGTVYYIDGSKNVHFHEVEETVAPWGFSDVPNKLALPDPDATYGMREYEDIADASGMANDAFVWGGSEWAGSGGGTVFARKQNAGSITAHGRWQYAETRFGELKDQGSVTARANVISSGNTTGAVGGDTARGLAVDQSQIRLAWFAHDVPLLSGSKAHLKPSDVVTVTMHVLGDGVNPKVLVLPLRSIKITFPTLDSTGKGYVRFDGFFGVQLSDPWWLWKFLRDSQPGSRPPPVVSTVDGDSDTGLYGAFGSFEPTPDPNGVQTTFQLPFAYIVGTQSLYRKLSGGTGFELLTTGDYTTSGAAEGQFSMVAPPDTGDELWFTCRIAGAI
jgi:hypothetical protein